MIFLPVIVHLVSMVLYARDIQRNGEVKKGLAKYKDNTFSAEVNNVFNSRH